DKLSGSENKVPEALRHMMETLAQVPVPKELIEQYHLDPMWTMALINWNSQPLIHEPPALVQACMEILKGENIVIPAGIRQDDHYRINGAIKERTITIFCDEVPSAPWFKGTLMCQMTVDERLAPRTLVTGEREWWNDAWHVVTLAAAYLKLRLLLQFNGTVFQYAKAEQDWKPVMSFKS
ncbi:MAG: hypothetical protein ACRD3W_31155, partial [Terriglobales bacterium]